MYDEIVLGHFARRLIRRKARWLADHPDFQGQSPEDLEQELSLMLIAGMILFDPVIRHANIFVTTVIERAVAGLVRKQRARKTGSGRVFHFSALSSDDQSRIEPSDSGCREGRLDMALDVAAAMTKLSPELRDLADRLKRQSVAEISSDLQLAQSTVWRRVAKIRKQFEDAGLRIYL